MIEGAEPKATTTGPRILIVEDDDTYAIALRALLESEGFDVVGRAANGAEAVDLASRLRPTLATVDLDMPVINGVEATRRLVELGVAVIIVTGTESAGDPSAAAAAGALASITKSDATTGLPLLIRVCLSN